MARLLLLAFLVAVSGCGGAPAGPSSPISPPPVPPKAANEMVVWVGSKTLTSASGGECLAPTFSALVGTTGTYELRVTQTGNSVSAVVADPKLGFVASYVGTADESSISLKPAGFYTPGPFPTNNLPCNSGQGVRTLDPSTTITMIINGNTATGTVTDDIEVSIVEPVGLAWQYTYVGELHLKSSFVLTRR
jgi:hypothetical protein